jgi:hypothetical protein
MKYRRIRSIIDRMVQFSALVYFSLICSDEEAKQLAEKDQADSIKEKGRKL